MKLFFIFKVLDLDSNGSLSLREVTLAMKHTYGIFGKSNFNPEELGKEVPILYCDKYLYWGQDTLVKAFYVGQDQANSRNQERDLAINSILNNTAQAVIYQTG